MPNGVPQFCRKSTLSVFFQTYILYNIFLENSLYALLSYKKELDIAFNPNWNSIIPEPTELPTFYNFNENGGILELAQYLKKIRNKYLIKEWIDIGSPEYASYKSQWEEGRRIELGLSPNDPFFEKFDAEKYFDGFVFHDLSGEKRYFFSFKEEDGDVFKILPQSLVLETYLSYDFDPINFYVPDDIKYLLDNNLNYPDSKLLNDYLPNNFSYNKLLLLKDPKVPGIGPQAGLEVNAINDSYYPYEIITDEDLNDLPLITYLKATPIEISFTTTIRRDAFQRDLIQFIIQFVG